jgi:hypothetical protein
MWLVSRVQGLVPLSRVLLRTLVAWLLRVLLVLRALLT